MSHSKENLVLHLKLDEIIEDGGQKKVIDVSDKAHDCEVKGNLKVVQDEVFGRCISFDGRRSPSYIEVPDSPDLQISGDITVEAWVYITKEVNFDLARIVGKGTVTKENYGLWYNTRSKVGMFTQDTIISPSGNRLFSEAQAIDQNKWYHFTGVLDQTNNQAYFYLHLHDAPIVSHNTLVVSESNVRTPLTSTDSLTIGSAGDNFGDQFGTGIHTGKIAHVRIYNKALSPEEIQQDIEEDLRAIASFDRTENLVLNLKLDEIIEEGNERKVIDALTGRKYNVLGNPEIVIDDKFGGCLSFDGEGDYVELIAADQLSLQNSSFTVEAWINIEDLRRNNQSILGNDEVSPNNSLYLIIRQKKPYLGFARNDTPGKTELAENNWYHITWRYNKNNQEQAIFVDGVLENSDRNRTAFQGNGIVSIGRWISGRYFKGKIAHVRIYNRALFPEEIKQDMDDDLRAIASFNKTYPLDFKLYEGEDKEPVIFIENGTKGQELTLEIVNNSDQPISFPSLSGEVSEANHHFELRFRPKTLSRKSLEQLVLAKKESWSMSSPVTQANGMVSLYFLATNNNQALEANKTIPLTLWHINGAVAGGARTTRVELRCPQFTYHGETVTDYYREKRLSIVSHRGKKHIPLHVGFVGSNRILNDWNPDKKAGSTNELILRITNVLKDKSIPFNPASKGDEASKLIISFDVQAPEEEKEWALGTKSEVENIGDIKGKDWRPNENPEEDWKIDKNILGETPTWTITHQNEEEAGLAPGQVVELTISKIISSLPSGQANLYVRYENIPGYWDGTFVCTIEKSPILYKEGNVGIGTNTPEYKLDVNGNTNVKGTIYRGGNPLIYENYEIYLRGSAYESSEGIETYLKIANVSMDMTRERGLNTVILNPDGSYKNSTSHDVYGDVNQWNAWANWINNADNVDNEDVVAVASFDAIQNAPSGGRAETLLRSINALKAFAAVQGHPRSPYALLFIKGKTGAIEVAQPYQSSNAHIKTTYYELFNYGNSSVVLRGMIMMWSGSQDHIPVGWALCDGTNGTPNLLDRFIVGAGSSYQVNATGGQDTVTLTEQQMPSHLHYGSAQSSEHRHVIPADTGGGGEGWGQARMIQANVYNNPNNWANANTYAYTFGGGVAEWTLNSAPKEGKGEHTHNLAIARSGGGQGHENRPPYYALAYIMKL